MRKHNLITGNVYHVYNRGVEKRSTFSYNDDYMRFIKDVAVFNDTRPSFNFNEQYKGILDGTHERKPLVDVIAFCLMPNHYHLLLRQCIDNGITEFMRKLGDGYTKYFNLKHERVGPLFQGKFKSVLIERESQFIYIPHYIHLNPLDLILKNWKERGVNTNNKDRAVGFIKDYKWSSFSDYIGGDDFQFILNKALINEYFGDINYKNDLISFINDLDLSDILDEILDQD